MLINVKSVFTPPIFPAEMRLDPLEKIRQVCFFLRGLSPISGKEYCEYSARQRLEKKPSETLRLCCAIGTLCAASSRSNLYNPVNGIQWRYKESPKGLIDFCVAVLYA